MLYSILQRLEEIILSLSIIFSCGLYTAPAEPLNLSDYFSRDWSFIQVDDSLRKYIMDNSQVRLILPELNFSLPCKYCLLGDAQDYVDMPNMAALFQNTLTENTGVQSYEIGDHNNQGFDIINELSPGMHCIINFNGVEYSFVCTRVDKLAMNRIDCLEFSDGTLLDASYPLGLYTCSYDGVHITLCAFDFEK